MAKRKTKKRTITCRLRMLGMEPPRDIIAILRPSKREIALSGRRTFKILSDLMKEILI